MTLAYPDPADPSGDTTWPPPTPPWPSLRGPRPGDDDMPVPTPTPWPQPGPGRMSLRIGHAPRRSRRERIARVLFQTARYLVALGVVVGAASWLTTYAAGVFWLGLIVAAMIANPYRPKQASPSAPTGAVLAVHPGPGALRRLRRPVTPLTPAA